MSHRPPSAGTALSGSSATVLGDRYQLGELLGRGGAADVYRATDRVLSRDVAVKILRDDAADETARARFVDEARTLAQLSHPHLVTLLDAGISARRPYLVMELVTGRTLAQACTPAPLSLSSVIDVGERVADALSYAHGRGVVHRDVKPANILVNDEGQPKLADFGVARMIGAAAHHTRTGQTVGTAAYLAPEQLTGGEVTGAADVYSLGLTLLEALTAQPVYSGSPIAAAQRRLSEQPPIPETLPAAWRDLLGTMTALAPEARPAASEVAYALTRLPVDETQPATRDSATDASATLRDHDTRRGSSAASPPESDPTAVMASPPTLTGVGPRRDHDAAAVEAAPLIDRAGDVLARQPNQWMRRYRLLDVDQRAAVGALAALVAFLIIVALLA